VVEAQSGLWRDAAAERRPTVAEQDLREILSRRLGQPRGLRALLESLPKEDREQFPIAKRPRLVVFAWKGAFRVSWMAMAWGQFEDDDHREGTTRSSALDVGPAFIDAVTGEVFFHSPGARGAENPTTGSGTRCTPLTGGFGSRSLNIVRLDATSTYRLKDTTRARPEAVRHTHRSVVTLMVAALYGVGLERGDRYFCPSSPAWGHGLWHGTIAPLALGIAVGAYAGKFDAERLLAALEAFEITNLAAAPTVFRLLAQAGTTGRHRLALRKISFTGEPMDGRTWDFIEGALGVTPCSMYGSTEVGVIIANYPGFAGYEVRRGALGKAAPGWEVAVVDANRQPLPPGQTGEIAVRRKDGWFLVKDRGRLDADGYFHIDGRSDDVIISAGWTMSAVEIENVLLAHPDVREAAVVGVADPLRGQIPKAFVVATRTGEDFARELQEHVRGQLSQHEYPRGVEFVDELPKTPAGKINRKALRDRAVAAP
jgi:acetyl-CoA synthetase